MRHGRAKQARRTLQFFRLNVGIQAPYYVLLDGCFLVAMVTQKVPLKERLDRLLQHEKFITYVTRSALDELNSLYEQTKQDVFRQARQWGLDECDILEEKDVATAATASGVGAVEEKYPDLGKAGIDVLRLVSSAKQPNAKTTTTTYSYFVATQDETLLDTLRFMGTVPCIRLSRGVTLLENPSKASQRQATRNERFKWSKGGSTTEQTLNVKERSLVQQVRKEDRAAAQQQQQQQQQSTQQYSQVAGGGGSARSKGKAKGPNPLSCKKKREGKAGTAATNTRKRRRKN